MSSNVSSYLLVIGAKVNGKYLSYELPISRYMLNIPIEYDDKIALAYLGFLTFKQDNRVPRATRLEIGVLASTIIKATKNLLFL